MLTVGRVSFAPRTQELVISHTRPAPKDSGVIGVANLLRAIGIVQGTNNWPLPCLDLNSLHKHNAERIRARKQRKKGT